MRTALLLAALLIVGATVAPTASAEHIFCDPNSDLPEKVCDIGGSHGIEIVTCLYSTAPKDWADCP